MNFMVIYIWVQCAVFVLAHPFLQDTFLVCCFLDFLLELDDGRKWFGIVHFLFFVAILAVFILVAASWIVWWILSVHTFKDF